MDALPNGRQAALALVGGMVLGIGTALLKKRSSPLPAEQSKRPSSPAGQQVREEGAPEAEERAERKERNGSQTSTTA